MKSGRKKIAIGMFLGLLASAVLIFHLFIFLSQQYQHNSAYSNASNLIEINQQGAVNVTTLLNKDQQLAREIKGEIERQSFDDESALLDYLSGVKENWKEDDIYVYTSSGRCYDTSGTQNGDIAAQRAADIVTEGESFNVIKSQTEYSIAVDTDLTVRGSQVVAVSVLHDLDRLFATINLSPYSGKGAVYLTRQNGINICADGMNVDNAYNILTNLENGKLEELTGSGTDIGTVMANGMQGAYLLSDDDPVQYVVLTPIAFMGETYYLFEIIPQSVIDTTMTSFTGNMTTVSVVLILLMLLIFALFLFSYKKRADAYMADIQSRERLFDLLVSHTQNAFLLLQEGAKKPVYVTSNISNILGDNEITIEKAGTGYQLAGNGLELGSRSILEINEALSKWDGKEELVSEYLPYEKGAERHYLRLSLYPILEDSHEFVGIVQDATREFEREQRLKDAVSLADSANRAKTGFLSSMSHDIRTPLNAIINMSRFLRDDLDDKEKATSEIGVIQQSSEHLLGLINNVLDLSRIESGKVTFENTAFDIRVTIRGVAEITKSLCEIKKQKFLLDMADIEHPQLMGDAVRLSQILINLLNNAVKFTQEGGQIGLIVRELPSISAGTVPFQFVVSDNGTGIPAEKVESIFDPFTRVGNEATRQTEGSGLGLAIARNFIEAQGGSISVTSALGEGSVFTVEMSFVEGTETGEEEKPVSPCTTRFDGLRALVVEDNEINLSIAETMLLGWGFQVESAENGQIAEKMFREHGVGYYSIIFMDIQMPVMDGYEATKAIRSSGKADAQSVPIIAMTANAFAEDVEKARSVGMDGHVAKPIDPDELRRTTGQFVKGAETGGETVGLGKAGQQSV